MLQRLRAEHGIGLVLITHDLGVVAGMAERVAVMYGGRIVERGAVEDVFYGSRHPYTRGLLASLPRLEATAERLTAIDGAPPTLARRPAGCAFHPRCRLAGEICRTDDPALRPVDAVETACHFAERLRDGAAVASQPAEDRDAVRL
jgi:peptide/nickel transport system ATP-binding protein